MHDIDRTFLEWEPEAYDEGESSFEDFEFDQEEEAESPFDEIEENELASALLEVTDENELDQFLGSFFKKIGRKAGRFIKSPVGRVLGGVLKKVAKTALPIAGTAVGGFFGGPLGASLGAKLGSAGAKAFGLEVEGLSPEDQDYEIARRFIRFAGAAARKAALASPGTPAHIVARRAITSAARRHAPGLLSTSRAILSPTKAGGRWIRRGSKIILFGV